MKKYLPYTLILLVFLIIYVSPFMYLFVREGRLDSEFLTTYFPLYLRNPITFMSTFDTEIELATPKYSPDENPFETIGEDETVDTSTLIPSDFPFTSNEISPMTEQEFVVVRDANMFGGEGETDVGFTMIDILNSTLGNSLIGGKISYSNREALQDVLVTTKSFCIPDNTFVYDSDWNVLQSENVDLWKALEVGDQLVTSCLDEECLYIGKYCAVIKW